MRRTKADMSLIRNKKSMHDGLLRLLAAYFLEGQLKAAAVRVGMGEQIAKNLVAWGRQEARVATNDDLLRRYWKAIGTHKEIVDEFGLSDRKLRYHFDEEYRERVRRSARDGMRKKRAAEHKGLAVHYDRLLAVQGNVCAICGQAEGTRRNRDGAYIRLSVDHDHQTGVIRELLCSACNMMLGCAKDNPETLQAAVKYLKRHARRTQHNSRTEAA